MAANNPLNPILGGTDRETMSNVYDVLAFVSRATETQVESSHSSYGCDEFSVDEMHGLALICQMLMQVLADEPAPTTPFG